jgi:hypothetical protein
MAELERRLADLRDAGFPPTPAIADAVRRRLDGAPAPRRRRLVVPRNRRALALAAGLAVLLAAGAAAAPVRKRVLDALGIGGVRISEVRSVPAGPARGESEAELGERVPLAAARLFVDFPVRVARALGRPDAVYVRGDPPGGRISLVYGRAFLTEFRGDVGPYIEKTLGPGTRLERVTIRGVPGYRLTGRPHAVVYVDARGRPREETLRLAGDTLLWTRDGITYRLEGRIPAARALRIARSV